MTDDAFGVVRCSYNGGCHAGNAKCCVGTSYGFTVGLSPPLFDDFRGQPWEGKYIAALEKYHALVEQVVGARGVCSNQAGSGDGVVAACDGCCGRCRSACDSVGAKFEQFGLVADNQGYRRGERILLDKADVGLVEGSDSGAVRYSQSTAGYVVSSSAGVGTCGVTAADVDCDGQVGKVVEEKSDKVISEKTAANRQKRAKKKERKLRRQRQDKERLETRRLHINSSNWRDKSAVSSVGYRGMFAECDEETRKKLVETRAKRFISENEACVRKAQMESDRWVETVKLQRKHENLQMLKVGKQIEALRSSGVETIQEDLEQRRLSQQLKIVQTRQKLELASAQDIESLKRRQASKILKDTETNKVAVERAYGALAGSDNLPSLVGGRVHTVKSGSISPNSSASEAEVRAIQKKNLDLEKQVEELTAELGKFKAGVGERQDYDGYDYSEGVTIDEDGHPIGDFGDYSGYIGRDNRFHFGESMMPYFD